MAEITESRLAMYEGIIALAWADHTLTAEEKIALHELIDSNQRFTAEQRNTLNNEVDTKVALVDIWPRITSKHDRAHLLDMASYIFYKDGVYCESEQVLYEGFLSKHLAGIDSDAVLQEVRSLAQDLRRQRETEEKELEIYAKQFSLIERLKRGFARLQS